MDDQPFQRTGATSNTHVGREFEERVKSYFLEKGTELKSSFPLPIGYATKKVHKFDLGCEDQRIVVECKSYRWTAGGNSPSAKLRSMNEAMHIFAATPGHYRRLLVLSKHMRGRQSLGAHYVRTQEHLIAPGVEVWELDEGAMTAERLA
jgi:hypothetical protein